MGAPAFYLGRPTAICERHSEYALGSNGEPELFYRLAPVMRIISANGGLPVLAAAAVLVEEGAYLQPGATGSIDGDDFEVDLLGWRGPELIAGEVKRTAAGFKDVEADVHSARFGADVHVAATFDAIDGTLRGHMKTACDANGLRLQIGA